MEIFDLGSDENSIPPGAVVVCSPKRGERRTAKWGGRPSPCWAHERVADFRRLIPSERQDDVAYVGDRRPLTLKKVLQKRGESAARVRFADSDAIGVRIDSGEGRAIYYGGSQIFFDRRA